MISSGPKAAYSIASTITAAGRNDDLDVILLTRGGGASTELTAYESEAVARAICECPVPVYAALGHSTDSTVADQCARAVAHTPSDAAERLIIEPVNGAHNLLRNEAQAVVNLATETVRQAERGLAALWEAVKVAHAQALKTTATEVQHRQHVEAVHRKSRTTVYALAAVANR